MLREGSVVVVTLPDVDGVTLRLDEANGTRILERHLASQDCPALAEAIAVIIEAHFLQVNQAQEAQARTSSAEASVVGAPNVGGRPVTPSLPSEAAYSATVAPVTRTNVVPSGVIALGPALTMPQVQLTAMSELAGGVDWVSTGVSLQLALFGNLPATAGNTPNRVKRWNGYGLVRAGFPRLLRGAASPWVGLGLEIGRTRALDVAGSVAQSSLSAVLGGGVAVAWPLSPTWAGQLDVSCLLLATRDSYRIEPDGEIGLGPRAVCTTALGLAWGHF